jgi:phage terminase small subunit
MAYLKKGDPVPEKGRGARLTAKMTRFIDEYMLDLNATQALQRAGYKSPTYNRLAHTMLQHPLVRAEIDKRMAARRDDLELSAQYVVQKLINIIENTEKSNPTAALRGLELAGKTLGLFKDRQEISGPDGAAIQMEQKTKNDAADFTSRISRLAERTGEGEVSKFPEPGSKGAA